MAKKSLRQQDSSDEEDIVLPTPPKKVVRKRNVTKRLIRKKPQGTKVPETLDDANEADRMMWFWKNSGKDWDEIRIEWARLTGVKPGKSSLSVRYIKLNENFARNGAAGVSLYFYHLSTSSPFTWMIKTNSNLATASSSHCIAHHSILY